MYCLVAYFALVAMGTFHGSEGLELLADMLLLALPLGGAFCAFGMRSALLHWVVWGALLPFTPLALYFLLTAGEVAAADAQSALIYIIEPIFIAVVCAGSAVAALAAYHIWHALHPTKDTP